MQDLPRHYKVTASAGSDGDVKVLADQLESTPSAPPGQFGGSGNRWFPENLLVAAVADCFDSNATGLIQAYIVGHGGMGPCK